MRGAEPRRYTVHWVAHSPSPYNAYLFRALAADASIELTVHLMHPPPADHPWKTRLTDGYNSHTCRRLTGVCWDLVRLAATDRRSLFVTGYWADPTTLLSLALLAARGRPFVIWTDTPNSTKRRSPIKASLRLAWLRRLFTRATRVMGTGMPAVNERREVGCAREKLIDFPIFVPLGPCSRSTGLSLDSATNREVGFVSVGTVIHSIKGHDIAVAALAKARALTGRDNFEYRIAGSGVDLAALRQQVRQLGLENRVMLLGWREPEEVERLYRDSDVLIHPSRRDAYGASVLEAMSAGLAVLGSDATAAVRDRIRHGKNGFVHRAGDVDELAGQIAQLLLHPEMIHDLAREARSTAEEWPVERGVEIIKTVLAEIHAGARGDG